MKGIKIFACNSAVGFAKEICDCLASISIQTIIKNIKIIIANDWPDDDYSYVKDRFPELDITILSCEQNGGPGLARQRCLDACKTDWITFIDSDDVFMSPLSLESLVKGIAGTDNQGKPLQNVIEVQEEYKDLVEKVFAKYK